MKYSKKLAAWAMALIVLTGSSLLIRDRKDQVCLGDTQKVLLRCKNQIGLSTVIFQGDSD